MKLGILTITVTVLVTLLLATTALAAVTSDPVRINSIRTPESVYAGDQIPVYVNYEAEEGKDIENLRVKAYLMDYPYELSYPSSDGRFDLDGTRSSRLFLNTAAAGSDGWAVVRVVVSNDDVKRVKHRWVKIW